MFDVTIMAHPNRSEQAKKLAGEVGAVIVWDKRNDALDTQDRAWGFHDHDLPWSVVLEDDALPAEGFTAHAATVLSRAPNAIISFYVGTSRPHSRMVAAGIKRAEKTGAGWLYHHSLLWNVAVAIPTHMVPSMLDYVETVRLPADQRISKWARAKNVPVYYPYPCLVDHSDGRSLLRHDRSRAPRRARNLGIPLVNDFTVPLVVV